MKNIQLITGESLIYAVFSYYDLPAKSQEIMAELMYSNDFIMEMLNIVDCYRQGHWDFTGFSTDAIEILSRIKT